MINSFDSHTLLIIPCCAAKKAAGIPLVEGSDPLMECVSERAYASVLNARARVLASTRADPRFMREKYAKNGLTRDGSDLGGDRTDGRYFTALGRYDGKLYRVPGFKQTVSDLASNESRAKILILSALYGPLHPNSPIQDYNLMMSDARPEFGTRPLPPFSKTTFDRTTSPGFFFTSERLPPTSRWRGKRSLACSRAECLPKPPNTMSWTAARRPRRCSTGCACWTIWMGGSTIPAGGRRGSRRHRFERAPRPGYRSLLRAFSPALFTPRSISAVELPARE